MAKLPLSFYQREDVVALSRELLGKYLFTHTDADGITGGIIVETEAYNGTADKACHAHGGKMTPHTQVMYREGGIAYIYLIYGFHYLLNVVTGPPGNPQAVLIRAIEPTEGIDTMLRRRNMATALPKLTAGPGVLCKALGITKELNGASFLEDTIWIEDRQLYIPDEEVVASPRVNVDYAGEDALLPWRFRIKNNKWTSPAK